MTVQRSAPDWARARCQDADPELFFPDGPGVSAALHQASVYCTPCPVKTACLQYAQANRLQGIWGGRNFSRRQAGS